jgi:DNA polymerase-3 subunit gamma/tau
VFIFATTESYKIPDTILGRCQRFDFKRVTVAQVVTRLTQVLKAEKIEFEEAALHLIARAAEGSMRDALSLLDQVISFSGLKITAQAVRESVGLLGTERVYAILSKILARDTRVALLLTQDAFNQGYDLSTLLRAMIEMLHAVVLFQVGVEKPETPFSTDELAQIAAMTSLRDLEENEMIFQVFHQGTDLLSRASQPKLVFDLLVIKASAAETLVRRSPRPPRVDRPSESEDDEAVTEAGTKMMAAPAEIPAPKAVAPVASPAVMPAVAAIPQAAASAPAKDLSPEAFMAFAYAQKPMLGLILESVIEWNLPTKEQPKLTISFREREKVKADQIMQKDFREQLAKLSETFFGIKPIVEAILSQSNAESVAERNDRVQRETKEKRREGVMAIPAVQEARALFGAELTQLEWNEKGNA